MERGSEGNNWRPVVPAFSLSNWIKRITATMQNPLRNLPSVNQLLESPHLKRLTESLNHQVVVDGVRDFLGDLRNRVSEKLEDVEIPAAADLAERIAGWLKPSAAASCEK